MLSRYTVYHRDESLPISIQMVLDVMSVYTTTTLCIVSAMLLRIPHAVLMVPGTGSVLLGITSTSIAASMLLSILQGTDDE